MRNVYHSPERSRGGRRALASGSALVLVVVVQRDAVEGAEQVDLWRWWLHAVVEARRTGDCSRTRDAFEIRRAGDVIHLPFEVQGVRLAYLPEVDGIDAIRGRRHNLSQGRSVYAQAMAVTKGGWGHPEGYATASMSSEHAWCSLCTAGLTATIPGMMRTRDRMGSRDTLFSMERWGVTRQADAARPGTAETCSTPQ